MCRFFYFLLLPPCISNSKHPFSGKFCFSFAPAHLVLLFPLLFGIYCCSLWSDPAGTILPPLRLHVPRTCSAGSPHQGGGGVPGVLEGKWAEAGQPTDKQEAAAGLKWSMYPVCPVRDGSRFTLLLASTQPPSGIELSFSRCRATLCDCDIKQSNPLVLFTISHT